MCIFGVVDVVGGMWWCAFLLFGFLSFVSLWNVHQSGTLLGEYQSYFEPVCLRQRDGENGALAEI